MLRSLLLSVLWFLPGGPRTSPVRLLVGGDVLLARGVGRSLSRHGFQYVLGDLARYVRRADVAFANLEGCLSNRGLPRRPDVVFRSPPGSAIILRRLGLDVLSLANNHSLDYGRVALMDTVAALRAHGLLPVGAGRNLQEAGRPVLVEVRGLKLAFLAFADVLVPGFAPLPDEPGISHADEERVARRIREVRRRADLVVVSFHWGHEYMMAPNREQCRFAELAVRSGADLVVGHHPHVLQPMGSVRGVPVAFSLGGLVWDGRIRGADKGAAVVFRLTRHRAVLERVLPTRWRRNRVEVLSRAHLRLPPWRRLVSRTRVCASSRSAR